MMKFFKQPIGIIGIIVLSAVVIGGIFLATRSSGPNFEFATAERKDVIQEVSVIGRVEPAAKVELAFEITGKVGQIHKNVGDRIEVGDLVMSLERHFVLEMIFMKERMKIGGQK